MTTTDVEVPRHPARFNADVMYEIARLVACELPEVDVTEGSWPRPLTVLDPFAGTGGIHQLPELVDGFEGVYARQVQTVAIELEPKWAAAHERTTAGSCLELLPSFGPVDVVATSPCYGNRMADAHDAKDDSRRNTYRHALGEQLQDGSAAAMQWGPAYRAFHDQAWRACLDALKPGGLAVVNIKNHIRAGVVQQVAEWHASVWMALGCYLHSVTNVPAGGVQYGENWDARVGFELVMAFRVPDPKPARRLVAIDT